MLLTKETTRDMWGFQWIWQAAQDLRYAVRSAFRNRGFTLAALVSIALGVGATTAVFSLLHHVVLRPLPYADPERLALVWTRDPRATAVESPSSLLDWQAWKVACSLSGLATFRNRPGFLQTGDVWTQVELHEVSAEFLPLTGVAPVLGRTWTEQEAVEGRAVVISDHLWRNILNATPNVLGATIVVSHQPYQIVGVMPPRFSSPSVVVQAGIRLSPQDSIWTPFVPTRSQRMYRGNRGLRLLARLRAGVTFEHAQRELAAISEAVALEDPVSSRGISPRVVPLSDGIAGHARSALVALVWSAGLLLLVACANVANLFLARGSARSRELATRVALGAGRTRLLRQLLTESLLISVTGGALGAGLAGLILAAARQASAVLDLPRLAECQIDARSCSLFSFFRARPACFLGLFQRYV